MLYLVTEYAKNGEIFGKYLLFFKFVFNLKMSLIFMNGIFPIDFPACLRVGNMN